MADDTFCGRDEMRGGGVHTHTHTNETRHDLILLYCCTYLKFVRIQYEIINNNVL